VLANSGSLALRAPEDTLNALESDTGRSDRRGAEVVIDVRLYMVDRTRRRTSARSCHSRSGVYNVESEARNLVQQNQSAGGPGDPQGLIPADATDIQIALALISSGWCRALY